jgi:undecaprenyl diphosphate synthase
MKAGHAPKEQTKDVEKSLAAEIKAAGDVPRHVAIIMDGNGRWAKTRGLPRVAGHRAGRDPVRAVVEGCSELGVGVLTLYTFSMENWNRPAAEVSALMKFLEETLVEEREELKSNNVRLEAIGRIGDLSPKVREILEETKAFLSGCTGLTLNLALSYGGRGEIVDGINRMLADAKSGLLPGKVDEADVQRYLYTSGLPDPDLLIRTGGEIRISNFLLWQLAYSELWMTDLMWPDFKKADLFRAVRDFQKRHRRFGRVD